MAGARQAAAGRRPSAANTLPARALDYRYARSPFSRDDIDLRVTLCRAFYRLRRPLPPLMPQERD